jgi:membrane-associated phospholipid phosphatase
MITPQMLLYSWWGLNKAIFLLLNGLHARWWDAVMLAATNAGSAGTFPYWIAAALLLAWLRPAMMPQLNVAVFAAGYVATGYLVPWLKSIIDFPRPFVALGRDVVTVVGHTPYGASFPSGHAAFVVLLCAALTPGVPKPIRWGLWIFASVVMLSRIVVGAHFPADVLGGAILGLAVAVLMRIVLASARR